MEVSLTQINDNRLAVDEQIIMITNQILDWSKRVNATASLELNDYIRLFRKETPNVRFLLVKTNEGDRVLVQEV